MRQSPYLGDRCSFDFHLHIAYISRASQGALFLGDLAEMLDIAEEQSHELGACL